MMEKLYKLDAHIEGTDLYEVLGALVTMQDQIQDMLEDQGDDITEDDPFDMQFIAGYPYEGGAKITAEERCSECLGTGEVSCDESDGEGHIMRGVGTQKCLCQIKEEDHDTE